MQLTILHTNDLHGRVPQLTRIATLVRQSLHAQRGKKIGMPHVAGMTIHYDPSNLETLQVHVGNLPLQKERNYMVAATDMKFSDLYGYLVIPEEQVEYELPTIMPEVLEDYIAKQSPVQAPTAGRMKILPG